MNELSIQESNVNEISELLINGNISIPARASAKDVFFKLSDGSQTFFYIASLPVRFYRIWVRGLNIAACYGDDGSFEIQRGISEDPNRKGEFLTVEKNGEYSIIRYPFLIANDKKVNKPIKTVLKENYPELVPYLLLNDGKKTIHKSSLSDLKFAADVQDSSVIVVYNVTKKIAQIGVIHQITVEKRLNSLVEEFKNDEDKYCEYPLIKSDGYKQDLKSYPMNLITDEKKVKKALAEVSEIRGENYLTSYFKSKEFYEEANKFLYGGYPEFA